eukprot:36992-Amphidinium_carterae.1
MAADSVGKVHTTAQAPPHLQNHSFQVSVWAFILTKFLKRTSIRTWSPSPCVRVSWATMFEAGKRCCWDV